MKSKKGFTLIELTLAIAFISILLITIGVVTVDIISVYRKGIAMKSVNSTGLDLIREFSDSIVAAPSVNYEDICNEVYGDDVLNRGKKEACKTNNAQKIIYQEYLSSGTVKINGNDKENSDDVPVAGAFCNGNESFLWNTGYVNNEIYTIDGGFIPGATISYSYIDPIDNSTKNKSDNKFRLLKISDPNRELCLNQINRNATVYGDASMYNNRDNFHIDSVLKEEPFELLPTTNKAVGLALYSFVVYPQTKNTSGETFNSASMILATIAGGVDITKSGDYCAVPTDVFSDFNYCAINKFNFAMRSTGE